MMEPGSPTADSDYREGLVHKMKTTIHKIASPASYRYRGSDGATGSGGRSHPVALTARPVYIALALLAALAAGFMLLLPGGPLHAQEGAIEYPENGTEPVATLTATDPEGESIVWSLATSGDGDREDFSIDEDGVLSFKSSPDFENPKGGGASGNSNTYVVTVQASDGGDGTTATEEVTIEVTNVEEPGMVTLSTLQPQVGVEITAILTDPDNA